MQRRAGLNASADSFGTIVPIQPVRAMEAADGTLRYTLAPFGRPFGSDVLHRVPGGMMPEILTESFCERCGTRYTFESAAPARRRRLGQFKTLEGYEELVMSDDSSLDEAMAAARSDEDRETTAQQLDAFH